MLQTEEVTFKSEVRVNDEGMRPETGEPSFKCQCSEEHLTQIFGGA